MARFVDEQSLADDIRRLLPEHVYLSHLVDILGVNIHKLITVCQRYGIDYPNKHASADAAQRAVALVIAGQTVRSAAQAVGISKSAVARYMALHRSKVLTSDEHLARSIESMLPTHKCLSNISRVLNVTVHRLIAVSQQFGIRYPNKHATDTEIKAAIDAVLVKGMSFSEAAAAVGISRSSVHRYVQKRRNASVSRGMKFLPMQVGAYRCPRHGWVTISPCVACEAMAARGEL